MEERKRAIESEIAGLKQILAGTDYKTLKFAEGQISEKDYAATKQQRQELRDKINQVEAELETIGESEGSEDAE